MPPRRLICHVSALGLLIAAAVGLSRPAATAATAPRQRPDEVLTREMRVTRWAHVNRIVDVRVQPSSAARPITSLHWFTEDGYPEVYELLRAHWDAAGREWIKLRVPMRPNGTMGWVRRSALGPFHVTHDLIVVDKATLRMTVLDRGRVIWHAPIAIGASGTSTPSGHFWIREKLRVRDRSSGYWPVAFGTSDYSTLTDWPGGGIVGIHGPYGQPQDIPGRVSHGCVRLRVGADAWLGRHIGVGVPVDIT